jgi:NADPH-dependent curcumin reductase CurA
MSRAITLARIPEGVPQPGDFALVDATLPPVANDQLACVTRFISLDPYLRGVLSGRHLGHTLSIGEIVPGSCVAQVSASSSTEFAEGDWVVAESGWREAFVVPTNSVRKIALDLAPPSTALGVLGMPGLTAWAGITQLANVRAGETVLISAALGPVGSSAGQIAKLLGARVIGIAGGPEKCRKVEQHFGFDLCLDYKASDFAEHLASACPNGVDVYFDNVGGYVLECALSKLALKARVVLCGLIDQYNQSQRPPGPNLGPVIGARATLMGLVVYDFYPQFPEFLAQVGAWVKARKLTWLEDIAYGIEATPGAFCKLMSGNNFGKMLVAL